MTATPWGFRDILPEEAEMREEIALTVKACLKEHHYRPIETPLLEDRNAAGDAERGADTPFKLFDDDGHLLVVRHDNTLPIVRLVSTRMATKNLPLRLRYEAPVVREQPRNAGRSRQFTQLGFELIGAGGVESDVEVATVAIRAIRALGFDDVRVICGSVKPFKRLLAAIGDEVLSKKALACVHANNFVDLDDCVSTSSMPAAVKEAICEIPRLHGGADVLDCVDELLSAAGVVGSTTEELRVLLENLAAEDKDLVTFDFSIMNNFDYYTGLVFKAYAGGLADPVGSGGRYDAIFNGVFDGVTNEVPAAGFAFSLDRLEEAQLNKTGEVAKQPLRIAVPKGSLKADTVAMLEAVGLDTSELTDPGRKLIVSGRDTRVGGTIGDVEFVIVRAQDAPAFVANGGAACGICGRDSLIEANLNLLQLVDLKYGACRFIEAEPASRSGEAEKNYARRGNLRVCTKYPRIAGQWYAGRGINADIVTMHGNIELGPIVGMTDRIVDITATGTTLKENDLVITGEVMECTARYFVNPGLSRLDPRVRELGDRLAAYITSLGAKEPASK